MKKIIAIVLSFAMLASTFAIMSNGVEAKTKKGYYFAMIQKAKSPWGYIKKAKIIEDKKVVTVNSKLSDEGETVTEPVTEQPTEQPTEAPTVAPTVKPTAQPQTKVVYGKGLAKLVTYGSFMYRKTDLGASKTIKATKRTFIISKKCKFYDKCWTKKQKKIKRKAAFKKFSKIKKHSLNECELVVKGGKVVKIKFGRG